MSVLEETERVIRSIQRAFDVSHDDWVSACQKGRNTRIAKVRARVEHVFAGLHQMGGQLIRTIGLPRS